MPRELLTLALVHLFALGDTKNAMCEPAATDFILAVCRRRRPSGRWLLEGLMFGYDRREATLGGA